MTLKRERVLTGSKARHLIASLGTIPINLRSGVFFFLRDNRERA